MAVILVQKFGQQAWILQAMTAIQEATQNCIENLSGTMGPVVNNNPLGQGGQYAYPARTAEELRSSSAAAAHAGQVSAAQAAQKAHADQADIALANGQLDMFAVLQEQAGLQDPASQGMPPTETPNEPGSDEWIL